MSLGQLGILKYCALSTTGVHQIRETVRETLNPILVL